MKKALTLIGLVLLMGCTGKTAKYEFNLNVVAEVMGCASVNDTRTDYETEGDKVIFTSYVTTPDSCYKLKDVQPRINEDNITINITLEASSTGFCDECTGLFNLVYEITKPPYNDTYVTVITKIRSELLSVHNFMMRI